MARGALIAIAVCLLLTSAIIPLAWSPPAQSLSEGRGGLLFIISVEKRIYLTGEAIGIRLVLINPTLSEISLGYVSGAWIDYEILGRDGVLYRWSDHILTPDWAREPTIAPLEVMNLKFIHEPSDYPLPSGGYLVHGLVKDFAEGYASLVVLDILPGLLLPMLSVALGIGLVANLVSVTGSALTRRPASKRGLSPCRHRSRRTERPPRHARRS